MTHETGGVSVRVRSDGGILQSFLGLGGENCQINFEVVELLKFWIEKIFEIDQTERERLSLRLRLEKMSEVISVLRSDKKVELRLGGEVNIFSTNLGILWKPLEPSWCAHPQASLNEELTERVRMSPAKDEDLWNLNVKHKLILPHRGEPK